MTQEGIFYTSLAFPSPFCHINSTGNLYLSTQFLTVAFSPLGRQTQNTPARLHGQHPSSYTFHVPPRDCELPPPPPKLISSPHYPLLPTMEAAKHEYMPLLSFPPLLYCYLPPLLQHHSQSQQMTQVSYPPAAHWTSQNPYHPPQPPKFNAPMNGKSGLNYQPTIRPYHAAPPKRAQPSLWDNPYPAPARHQPAEHRRTDIDSKLNWELNTACCSLASAIQRSRLPTSKVAGIPLPVGGPVMYRMYSIEQKEEEVDDHLGCRTGVKEGENSAWIVQNGNAGGRKMIKLRTSKEAMEVVGAVQEVERNEDMVDEHKVGYYILGANGQPEIVNPYTVYTGQQYEQAGQGHRQSLSSQANVNNQAQLYSTTNMTEYPYSGHIQQHSRSRQNIQTQVPIGGNICNYHNGQSAQTNGYTNQATQKDQQPGKSTNAWPINQTTYDNRHASQRKPQNMYADVARTSTTNTQVHSRNASQNAPAQKRGSNDSNGYHSRRHRWNRQSRQQQQSQNGHSRQGSNHQGSNHQRQQSLDGFINETLQDHLYSTSLTQAPDPYIGQSQSNYNCNAADNQYAYNQHNQTDHTGADTGYNSGSQTGSRNGNRNGKFAHGQIGHSRQTSNATVQSAAGKKYTPESVHNRPTSSSNGNQNNSKYSNQSSQTQQKPLNSYQQTEGSYVNGSIPPYQQPRSESKYGQPGYNGGQYLGKRQYGYQVSEGNNQQSYRYG